MASNASRGAAAKGRTKRWLIAQGYQVADLEVVRWVFKGGQRTFPIKRDQLGADLLAVNRHGIHFVQVKSGKSAAHGSYPAAQRKFAAYEFPPGVGRWIVGWPPRARVPRIVQVRESADK